MYSKHSALRYKQFSRFYDENQKYIDDLYTMFTVCFKDHFKYDDIPRKKATYDMFCYFVFDLSSI